MNQDEFRRIVERAIELETAAKAEESAARRQRGSDSDREFTEEDLAEVAEEAGIDRAYLQRAIREIAGTGQSILVKGSPSKVKREFAKMLLGTHESGFKLDTDRNDMEASDKPLTLIRNGNPNCHIKAYFEEGENGFAEVRWKTEIQTRAGVEKAIGGGLLAALGSTGFYLGAPFIFLMIGAISLAILMLTDKAQVMDSEKKFSLLMNDLKTMMEVLELEKNERELAEIRGKIAQKALREAESSGPLASADNS